MGRLDSAAALEELRQTVLSRRNHRRPCITLCSGTGCHAYASEKMSAALERELARQGLEGKVDFRHTGCHGFCEKGPIVAVYPRETCYLQVQPTDAADIVSQTASGGVVERLLYLDPETGGRIAKESEIPFYKYQTRLILGNNTRLDPRRIEDYMALGGYSALAKALARFTPKRVLNEVKRANLRGRGGGGFPAGLKWESCRQAPGDIKYVIVNCDEGDPGAYMDRSLMEGNPHSVLEGLTIGAYAIGAHQGYVYVRQEYPLAVENLGIAIEQAERLGLLGRNILGSGFDFSVKMYRGAGAFVSGESSALMTAIEGLVGEPRPKYLHTAVSGIYGRPSCLNNVETWANVPLIINRGDRWFRRIGTEGSKGTKIFSLVGKVNNTGLVEVPMGISLRDIIYKIGGGIPQGKKFKAVQTGGPSGGCIPEEYLDTPVDFDALTKLGSMMGSGGMIVMDEDTCMVDVARYFVNFLCDESCGKCLPCRQGLWHMRRILTDITQGRGSEDNLDTVEELSYVLRVASLCALGSTAPNPVLTTIEHFRDEYEEHIKQRRCRAGVCKALISYYIDPQKCQACLICLRNCPEGAIQGDKGLVHVIDQDKCTKCGICMEVCPPRFDAIRKLSGEPVPAAPLATARVLVKGRGGSQ